MANSFAVKLQTPWMEPEDLPAPTAAQLSGGVVVCMIASTSSMERSMLSKEFWLVDPAQAEGLLAGEYARHPTERERKCAEAVGGKWPKPGVKAATSSKGNAKGGSAAKGG